MLDNLLALLIAFLTSLQGLEVPTSIQGSESTTAGKRVGDALCEQVYEESWNDGTLDMQAKEWVIESCTGPLGNYTLTFANTANGAQESDTYIITYTASAIRMAEAASTNVTAELDLGIYGPSCTFAQIDQGVIIIECLQGDGGMTARNLYEVDLTTGKTAAIARCAGRPLSILNASGQGTYLTRTEDCTYPFGTAEDAPIPYGNDGIE